uniref:Peptidase S1 domain-containing protein n=1 Tax=Chelonoidis abingdonii TaxID=106734 RepID=A0A8C0QS26_CHEAB
GQDPPGLLTPSLAWSTGLSPLHTQGHRIIGGRECRIGSRPYQVALLRNGRIYCGGSLIAPKWVLTAAHCSRRINSLRVHLGDYNLWVKEPTEQIRRIRNFFVHPEYNLRHRDNDFMLLELDKPALLNSYVNTINLATHCPSPGTRCSVSGWGTIESPQSMEQLICPLAAPSPKCWASSSSWACLVSAQVQPAAGT